jgi:hypothetical protein
MQVDRRLLALVLVLSAVWWAFTAAKGCQGGRPRPAELVLAERRGSEQ